MRRRTGKVQGEKTIHAIREADHFVTVESMHSRWPERIFATRVSCPVVPPIQTWTLSRLLESISHFGFSATSLFIDAW